MDETFDLEFFLPYLLNQAAEASSLRFQKIYKERYGLLRNDWRVLFHLGLYGQMTAREICDRASLHKTKISRSVHRLAARRYLTRERDENDRRVEHLCLTPAGTATYRDLSRTAQKYDADLVAQMSADEVAVLRRLLRHMAHA